jgi:hypothetical protein
VKSERTGTDLSGSFGILNKEIPGLFFALLPHHRAMQYVPPAFDLLQICFIGEALTVFLLKPLLLLLLKHVFVTNEVDSFDLRWMTISVFDKHSTFWQLDAVFTTLSGTINSSFMLQAVFFPSGNADSEQEFPQDISAILSFAFL